MVIAECLLIKNENRYLAEHFEKNCSAGISRFYIYDNISDTPVEDYVRQHLPEFAPKCVFVRFPSGKKLQLEAYAHFVKHYGHEADWCSFTDTDEIYEGDLRALCGKCGNYAAIRIVETAHGCNGHVYDSPLGMCERFAPHIVPQIRYYKMIAQPRYIRQQQPHRTLTVPGAPPVYDITDSDGVRLHHFIFRSFEEWIQKYRRGSSLPFTGFSLGRFFKFGNAEPTPEHEALMARYGVSADYVMPYIKSRELS